MKQLLKGSLLGLPLLLLPSQAQAWGDGTYPYRIGAGHRVVFSIGRMPQAGPWYLYWPYEAHFGMAAPNFGAGCPGCGVSGAWWGPWPGWNGSVGYGAGAPGDYYGRAGFPQAPMMAQPQAAPGQGVPLMAQPNMPVTPMAPAVQPTAYMPQVPSYWYGR